MTSCEAKIIILKCEDDLIGKENKLKFVQIKLRQISCSDYYMDTILKHCMATIESVNDKEKK